MSDRIHSIVSAVAKEEDPASMILAIRKVLRAERDEGYDGGYSDCLRDSWEAKRLGESIGKEAGDGN